MSGFASGGLTRSRPEDAGTDIYRNSRDTARPKRLNFPEPVNTVLFGGLNYECTT